MDPLLLEGITNAGESPHQGRGFARLAVAQLPLPLLLVQPYPIGEDAIGLIRQKVHDVVMGGLQRIQLLQLAPIDEDTGICLIGIEGRVRLGTAQEASGSAVELRIEHRLQ
ncbi:hypothetical protein D3C79_670400 [compost metagenome]